MSKVKLTPFTVDNLLIAADEIPYGVKMIKAPKMWDRNYRGKGVVIAVIDSGCDTNHPDLKGRIIGGYNFTRENKSDYKNFSDNYGHGTHVAGIIAASENGSGVIGVAPEAKLLVLKAVSENGVGEIEHLIKAINYAISWQGAGGEKAGIISLSLGTPEDVPELHEVIKKAVAANILVVASAGNEGDGKLATSEIQYPAYYQEVVAVGAVDANGSPASFSNTNKEVDILAPGVKILSTFLNGTYAELSGTSMAAPHVSGAAALLISSISPNGAKLTGIELYKQILKRGRLLNLNIT